LSSISLLPETKHMTFAQYPIACFCLLFRLLTLPVVDFFIDFCSAGQNLWSGLF